MSPKTRHARIGILVVLCIISVLLLAACTGTRLRGVSTGWSPAAAIAFAQDTGVTLDEGGALTPQDNVIRVTDSREFEAGQILQIGEEQIRITSIRDDDLTVERGFNGTRAQIHSDGAVINNLGGRFVVFVVTKDGAVKALVDAYADTPSVAWIFSPEEIEQ